MFNKGKKSFTVYTAGAQVLRDKAEPIPVVDDHIKNLASEMTEAMRIFNGIGLAAPQYGHSLRLVVFDIPMDSDTGSPGEALLLPKMPLAVINPEIVAVSDDSCDYTEGCLSVPDIYAPVARPSQVVFRAQTLDGEFIEVPCGGLLARCIQHELDHLDGVLFIDRVNDVEMRKIRGDIDRLKRIGQTKNYRRTSKK